MDELHTAIAAHLHAQREPRDVARQSEAAILGIWGEQRGRTRCRYCGRPLDRDDQRHDLGLRGVGYCQDNFPASQATGYAILGA